MSVHSIHDKRMKPSARVFIPFLLATLVVMAALNFVGAPLAAGAAKYGIVSYELSWNGQKAGEIIASWDENGQLRAAFSLGLDYLFMPLYAVTIGLACVWSGEVLRRRSWPLPWAGWTLAYALVLAAILDAVENYALLALLLGRPAGHLPLLAACCATAKFLFVFIGLVYAFLGAAVRLVIPER